MPDVSPVKSRYDSLLYLGQFFISQKRLPDDHDWQLCPTEGGTFFVYRKPRLSVSVAKGSGAHVVGLGEIADPSRPELANEAIVAELANAANWSDLETALDDLAGRWVLIVTLGQESRIYHDAAGLRSVHYYFDETDGTLYAGSQPNLFRDFLGLRRDELAVSAFEGPWVPKSNGWPGETTPVADVRRLLPNHYLDCATGRPVRYWPRERIESSRFEETAAEVARLITGAVAAALQRGEVWLPLTAGYDSRVILGCAKPFWDRLHFVNFHHPRTSSYDREIPQKLIQFTGRKLTVVKHRPPEDDFMAICDRNAGNLFRDQQSSNFYSLFRQLDLADRPDRPLFVYGHLAGITRCFWYANDRKAADVDVGLLCRKSWYFYNELARRDYAKWLSEFPEDAGIDVLTLFYWECRAGTWLAAHSAFHEAFLENLAPFNCRRLLALALGLDVRYRQEPHVLFRHILNITEPRALRYPFNGGRLHSVLRMRKKLLNEAKWRAKFLLTAAGR